MRKFLAVAALVAGVLTSVPASAQLGGLLGVLNGGRNIGNTVRYGCSGTSGLGQLACQAQRATNVSQQVEAQRQQMRSRQQRAQQQEERVNRALERACKLGDQESCQRAGPPVDPRQTQLQQALEQACDAGDDVSCRRVRDMSRRDYARRDDYGY